MLNRQKTQKVDSSFSSFIRTASSGEKKRVYKSVIAGAVKDQSSLVNAAHSQDISRISI